MKTSQGSSDESSSSIHYQERNSKKAVTRPKPSYDQYQQNWCVSAPAGVLSSVASVVASEDVRGSPGGTPCHPQDARPLDAFPSPPVLASPHPPTPTPPSIPQPLAFSGESLDDFSAERALIDAQTHIPVGGKLQFFGVTRRLFVLPSGSFDGVAKVIAFRLLLWGRRGRPSSYDGSVP